jgi:hypothetical protein
LKTEVNAERLLVFAKQLPGDFDVLLLERVEDLDYGSRMRMSCNGANTRRC